MRFSAALVAAFGFSSTCFASDFDAYLVPCPVFESGAKVAPKSAWVMKGAVDLREEFSVKDEFESTASWLSRQQAAVGSVFGADSDGVFCLVRRPADHAISYDADLQKWTIRLPLFAPSRYGEFDWKYIVDTKDTGSRHEKRMNAFGAAVSVGITNMERLEFYMSLPQAGAWLGRLGQSTTGHTFAMTFPMPTSEARAANSSLRVLTQWRISTAKPIAFDREKLPAKIDYPFESNTEVIKVWAEPMATAVISARSSTVVHAWAVSQVENP